MSVNSEMTAIADLIRGLRGVSGKMGLDAMKGHLQDEQDGLDSALAALTEKGVTVPEGTKVDGLAALIAAIEAGGGSGGGGFNSNHVDIAYGSFTPAEGAQGVIVDCGFPISKDDAFMYVFASIPIATRTESANIAGYFASKMPSAALPNTAYGGTYYASNTATKLSSGTSVNIDNVFKDTTGNDIKIRGYGAWNFVPSHEYFWIVVKEKNV